MLPSSALSFALFRALSEYRERQVMMGRDVPAGYAEAVEHFRVSGSVAATKSDRKRHRTTKPGHGLVEADNRSMPLWATIDRTAAELSVSPGPCSD